MTDLHSSAESKPDKMASGKVDWDKQKNEKIQDDFNKRVNVCKWKTLREQEKASYQLG